MTTEEAIKQVIKKFPFEGYMSEQKAVMDKYSSIANIVMRYLQPNSSILDFGAGPCDKIAVLQLLGFHCSGYDDLQDYWHKLPGNREKILAFISEFGIDFKQANGKVLPFKKESFDMVMLHDVLEHLHDSPRDLLNDLLELVKPEGLLFITVPNAASIRKRIYLMFGKTNLQSFESYYWYPGTYRGHVREYVRNDLVKLSEYLNLETLELRACDRMTEWLPRTFRPIYLFLTDIFNKDWKDSWLLVARKTKDWSNSPKKTRCELEHILGKITNYTYREQADCILGKGR